MTRKAPARAPLDRLRTIIETTHDLGLINWLCMAANGFFVANPEVKPDERQEQFLGTTQRMVEEFGDLLSETCRSIEDDAQISPLEADRIRQAWERLKTQAECFVAACERGMYGKRKPS